MLFNIIKHQCGFALRQKKAIFTFYILLLIVLTNYTINVYRFQGLDLIEMYNPAKLILLSFNHTYESADCALLLVQLYPILVVLPAGFMLQSEKCRKEDILLISRIGTLRYYGCSLITAFIVTMTVFTIPFLAELLLNCFAFPLGATGDFLGYSQYDSAYIELTKQYLFSNLYNWNCYLYSICGILFFGLVSGILGMFTVAISIAFKIKYKILLFLPVVILLNIYSYIPRHIKPSFSIRWIDYVFLFNDLEKSGAFFVVTLFAICLISILFALRKRRGDAF